VSRSSQARVGLRLPLTLARLSCWAERLRDKARLKAAWAASARTPIAPGEAELTPPAGLRHACHPCRSPMLYISIERPFGSPESWPRGGQDAARCCLCRGALLSASEPCRAVALRASLADWLHRARVGLYTLLRPCTVRTRRGKAKRAGLLIVYLSRRLCHYLCLNCQQNKIRRPTAPGFPVDLISPTHQPRSTFNHTPARQDVFGICF
jgi:hypothetical protein